ncbi:cell division protein FtsZ [Candidatus Bathyarchaeota archaeon ex4484_205]|nr:MAG: cell division protein FtsZ [Candidatus Bathyarchaeota archaeon ex4484_205]
MEQVVRRDLMKRIWFGSLKSEDKTFGGTRILLVGAGGAGCNTVDRLMRMNIENIETLAINTDGSHLQMIRADRKILIGEEITGGLGAGGDPEIGYRAIMESIDEVEEAVKGADIVFVAAGMGGGTGTAVAPVVAEVARNAGSLVIGVVTMPFKHEKNRIGIAVDGLSKMRRACHTIAVIENDRLLRLASDLPVEEALQIAETTLVNMIRGITDTISKPGTINLDFADIRSLMRRGGVMYIGIGISNAPNRAEDAVRRALNNPLIDLSYDGATGALIYVTGDYSMTLSEVVHTAYLVSNMLKDDANVFWGYRIDPSLKEYLKVTLLLTGVKSPQLYSGYGFYPIELPNIEPDSGMEEEIPIEFGLYQMEKSFI